MTERRYNELGLGGLWRQDWQDWREGNRHRLWARRGYLRPIEGRAPLVWLRAGPASEEIRLAADLLGAIRTRRHDLRLILTYEREDLAVLRERLDGMERERIAFGYGPGGRGRWLRRSVARMQPRAVITVGHAPEAPLREAVHGAGGELFGYGIDSPPTAQDRLDWLQPLRPAIGEAWCSAAESVMPAADPPAVLAQAQVEPVLPAMLGGEALVWLAGVDDWEELERSWAEAGRGGILFVTPATDAEPAPRSWPRISAWDRRALPGGTIVVVDDPRWHAVIAVSAEAIHLLDADSPVFWQALAAHRPVTLGGVRAPSGEGAIPCPRYPATAAGGLAAWRHWRENPVEARNLGRDGRNHFWSARRRVQDNLEVLLQRIEAW